MQNKFVLLLMILLFFLLQACSTVQHLQVATHNPIDSLLVSDFFKSSQAAISFYDLTDQKPIYQHNEKLLLRPASNQKILTTAAAYLFLGPDYKFRTSIYHTGEVKDSICTGDLFVVGGLDPDFSSRDLDTLIGKLKLSGIKKINGNIFADISAMDSLFWGEGWMWDDDPASYAAYLSPITINKNSVRIVYEPGEIGKPVKINIIPETNYFEIYNTSQTTGGGKSDLNITRDWLNRKNTIIVSGNLSNSAERDTVSLNVFDPTFYFLHLMKESLAKSEISFTGKVDTMTIGKDAAKLFSLEREIDRVIINTNKTSDNLSAEMILRTLAYKNSGYNSSAKKGIELVDSLISLAGLNPKNYLIADGSGLSFYNLLSAELLTEVLKYFYNEKPDLFQKLSNSFPISGIDGTLSNRMKKSSAFKRVFAKTGTISGASNLSGYLLSKSNHMIAFSILVQNYTGRSARARTFQDKLCEIIIDTY